MNTARREDYLCQHKANEQVQHLDRLAAARLLLLLSPCGAQTLDCLLTAETIVHDFVAVGGFIKSAECLGD